MGTWGIGSFDNDSAADFVQEVIEDGEFALREAFEVVLDPELDYLEAEEAARALAAAEILNAVLNADTSRITDAGLRNWVQNAPNLSAIQELACEALERILSPESELPELWEESPEFQSWLSDVQRLRQSFG